MDEDPEQAAAAYHRANVLGSENLVKAAISAGVERVIFISSVKAAGEETVHDHQLVPSALAAPEDAYGKGKLAAEQVLITLCEDANIHLQIIRPPLIHGVLAKGNLRRLLHRIANHKIMPVGAVDNNQRSLLGLTNAANAIAHTATQPWPLHATSEGTKASSANGKWRIDYLADSGSISTRRLVEVLGEGMDIPPRIISITSLDCYGFSPSIRQDPCR